MTCIVHDMKITEGGPDEGVKSARPPLEGMIDLLEVAQVLYSRIEGALLSVGLSVAKYQAIGELVRAGGPLALSALAESQQCVRSNITQLVDRLEADGLAKRVDDPTDRRAVLAVITPLGAERFAAGTEAVVKVKHELMSGVSDADRANFLRVLTALRNV
jgi:DNA-binding MarR family transcriptional regulator